MQNDPLAELTGYICPDCGGALSKQDGASGTQGNGQGEYQCRIGHTFTPAQLWIKTCLYGYFQSRTSPGCMHPSYHDVPWRA
jgi:hypothetical protein